MCVGASWLVLRLGTIDSVKVALCYAGFAVTVVFDPKFSHHSSSLEVRLD